MTDPIFAALIPAAGESSRMGEFKPLVEIGGQTLVERGVELFKAAGVSEIVFVAGHRSGEIAPVLEGTSARVITNPAYREGMLTSIQAGARELRARCDGFFVLPVDIPLVRPPTIRRLMERFEDRSALVYHPVIPSAAANGTRTAMADKGRGHPPLIDASLMDELLSFDGAGGLKGFLEGYADRSVEVPVADAWIRRDVDTGEELEALRRGFERYTIPTPGECEVILDHYLHVPGPVQDHSRAVARAAAQLGIALNAAGQNLDLDLVNAAALLHDCFKGREDHAGKAGDWLRENGFPEAAAIAAVHIDLSWKEGDAIDEKTLVYLADKIVEGKRVVTVEERRQALLDRYGQNEEARRAISARLATAEGIQAAVEKITGKHLSKILGSFEE